MSKKQNESSFEFEKELKNAMDGIEMPEDSRRRVRDGVKAASREEHAETVFGKKPFPVRRVVLIAAAVLLVAALTAGLVVWMRPSAPQDPATVPEGSGEVSLPDARPIVSSAEGDWVTDLFKEEAPKENGSGTIADSDASYLPSGAWKTEERTAEDKPSSSAKDSPDMYAGEEPAYYEEPGEALPAVDGYAGWPAREEPYGYGKGGSGNGVQASAGTLTAGRQDDNRYFSEFLKKMEEMSGYAPVWKIYPSRRLTVLAEGINNAKVALSDEKGNVLSYARTNAEGYAYLYYDLYDEKSASVPYKIGVSNGETFGEYVLKGDEGDVIRLSCGEPLEMKKLDVLIMLDTTGSMGDEISYLQAELEDVMKRVKAEAGNATVRLSMNFYRDHGDNYTVDYHPFTEDISECVSLLMKESADGGGDFPEAVDEALLNACDHAWDPDAVKIMFLILDAPPHEESDRQGTLSNLRKAIDSARRQGVRIVPVVASGIDDSTEYLMRSVAASTGGVYVFLTNHSGVGGDHKDPNVDQYAVEKLNDLMVKIILSYWNGTPIEDPQKTEESGETGETSETGDIDIEPSEPEHLFWGEDGTVSIPSAVSEHPLLKPVAEIYQYSVHAGWIDPESDPDVYDGCNNADVVNRGGTRGGHLPVFLVRSAEDYRYIAETYPELCLEGTEDAFGDAFFEDAALAVLYVPASSGSARFHVFYMITGGDNFVAHVAEEREGDGTTDMSGWTIVAAVPRATADAASKADAVLEKE